MRQKRLGRRWSKALFRSERQISGSERRKLNGLIGRNSDGRVEDLKNPLFEAGQGIDRGGGKDGDRDSARSLLQLVRVL